jgi:nucleoside-diphosphate-sugar epimerase
MSDCINSLEALEERLSRPPPSVVETMRQIGGDIIVLGIAGKMGPSLAHMARRASDAAGTKRRIIGVARFTSKEAEATLEQHGIETVRCDLLNEPAVRSLPDCPNVLYLAGMKFGATGQEALTWAMNAQVPALISQKFSRSRIIAFSTGNVYGLVPATSGGSCEADAPAPVGEYAMSCLARERIFEHFSRTNGTRMVIVRLNYACDLRYGVLVDLAQRILSNEPVDIGMSWFNTIWQGDANAMTLNCFQHTSIPPLILNMTGPEKLNVRESCEKLGRLLGKTPRFLGAESATALLSDSNEAFRLLGPPQVSADELIVWVADWIQRGGSLLNKPTHFESRDGKF